MFNIQLLDPELSLLLTRCGFKDFGQLYIINEFNMPATSHILQTLFSQTRNLGVSRKGIHKQLKLLNLLKTQEQRLNTSAIRLHTSIYILRAEKGLKMRSSFCKIRYAQWLYSCNEKERMRNPGDQKSCLAQVNRFEYIPQS